MFDGSTISKRLYTYNITRHRATDKSPFLLFHGVEGFNTILSSPLYLDEIDEIMINEEQTEEAEYRTWNLEEQEEIVRTRQEAIHEEVMAHFENYRARMIENANPNIPRRQLEFDDCVLLKIDFDANPQTRRHPFDSAFEQDTYVVLDVLPNNLIKIYNPLLNEIKIVSKTRLKKTN